MQTGLVGVLTVHVMCVMIVIAVGTKQDTEVAKPPDAGALVMGAHLILHLVLEVNVRDIAYFTCSKIMKCVLI